MNTVIFVDYVSTDNYFYELGNLVGKANILSSQTLRWGANQLDLTDITPELLSSLNELGGSSQKPALHWDNHWVSFISA